MKGTMGYVSGSVRLWWKGPYLQRIFWTIMFILVMGVLLGTFLEWTVGKPTADEAGNNLPHSTLVQGMKARNADNAHSAAIEMAKEEGK